MKKILFYALLDIAMAAFTSCGPKFECRIETVNASSPEEASAYSDMLPNKFPSSDAKLNELGKEGWELIDVYTTSETVHPNFGNSSYVTGIQPNVRTREVNFVFKREK